MKHLKSLSEFLQEQQEREFLLEARNAANRQEEKSPMTYATIRAILRRTHYAQGESAYLYNVLTYLMAKRK